MLGDRTQAGKPATAGAHQAHTEYACRSKKPDDRAKSNCETCRRISPRSDSQYPEKSQQYCFDDIGAALGIGRTKVRLSLAEAGLSWVSVEVSAKDRAAITKLAKNRGGKR